MLKLSHGNVMKKIYYTVYLSKTDEIIASGTGIECMKQLQKKSLNSFYSLVSKNLKGVHKKYNIYKEYLNDD